MSESDSPHRQCPLSKEKDDIRLFNLHPGDWNEAIRGDFVRANLTNHPPYTALSYVWGDPAKAYSVLINGKDVEVTVSLYFALRRIRAHNVGQPILLWTDALCVDQENLNERNGQVQIMGSIYSKCQVVIVWLGELLVIPDADSQELDVKSYKLIGSDEDYNIEEWKPLIPRLSGTNYEDMQTSPSFVACNFAWLIRQLAEGHHIEDLAPFSLPELEDSHYTDIFLGIMRGFYLNSWFERLWVIQEAVLAPSVLVYYGPVAFPLELLIRARDSLAMHRSKHCCELSHTHHYKLSSLIPTILSKFNEIHELRGKKVKNALDKRLLELCLRFTPCQATLDVDRIYALNGLSSLQSPVSKIVPDYGRPTHTLYEEVSRDHILSTISLIPLVFSGLKHLYPEMPSWAIDWTAFSGFDARRAAWWYSFINLYQFRSAPISIPPTFHGSKLIVHGFALDVVSTVGQKIDRGDQFFFSVLPAAIHDWIQVISAHHSPTDSYPGFPIHTWDEALLRSLCADICYPLGDYQQRVSTSAIEKFRSFAHRYWQVFHDWHGLKIEPRFEGSTTHLLEGDQVDRDTSGAVDMVFFVTNAQRLFMTQKGYIGFANKQIRLGDEIFLIPGTSTPLVLRPANLSKEISPFQAEEFVVVSDCYVHGFMDGEGMSGEGVSITIV
ncbi:hypothetical protein CC78DRAFT_267730 [Lojkania enalia]|uniref:Heterokaryon incompatibility domain-containing protein n=1 Tax=Lojkania enalia TaxID=147567 RepID=A0A9P4KBY6_9PLEO|nr:hypothetical protein CC78DRAFT_267730 [Didymosphaeria enalia]